MPGTPVRTTRGEAYLQGADLHNTLELRSFIDGHPLYLRQRSLSSKKAEEAKESVEKAEVVQEAKVAVEKESPKPVEVDNSTTAPAAIEPEALEAFSEKPSSAEVADLEGKSGNEEETWQTVIHRSRSSSPSSSPITLSPPTARVNFSEVIKNNNSSINISSPRKTSALSNKYGIRVPQSAFKQAPKLKASKKSKT